MINQRTYKIIGAVGRDQRTESRGQMTDDDRNQGSEDRRVRKKRIRYGGKN